MMLSHFSRTAIAVILNCEILACFHNVQAVPTDAASSYDALINGITADGIRGQKIRTTYDYVIVGGGAGGMLMAMRLTEDPRINVAVIEAGTLSESLITVQPGQFATSNFVDTTGPLVPEIDWLDVTLPLTANGNSQHYPQGKMIGGSTARGLSAYTRPTVGSQQRWASQVGDDAYLFENFEPYLKKSVQFTPPNVQLRGDNTSDIKFNTANWDKQGGPVQVSFPNYAAPYATWMKRAFEQTGAASAVDFVSGSLSGVQWLNVNINPQNQHRSYAGDFFQASRSRTNLKVFAKTTATKVLFDNSKTAQGILALGVDNSTIQFMAAREVILSAGVFRTPQLLMVSGIGPAETLKKFNIPIVMALESVGQNLTDRPFVGTTYQVNMDTTSHLLNADKLLAANKSYFASPPTGILTGTVDMTSFENVPTQFADTLSSATKAFLAFLPSDWPALEYLPINGDLLLFRTTASKPPPPQAVMPSFGSISAALAAPQSKGSVTIRSPNFTDPPMIDLGYLNNEADIELLMIAFKRSRLAWRSMVSTGVVIGNEFWPGYDFVPDDDDEKIRGHVMNNVMPLWEAAATCAMSSSASTGVVDSGGRVFGVRGLRVVDASAMPFSPPGHVASAVWGMAELIAERVKGEFNMSPSRKVKAPVMVNSANRGGLERNIWVRGTVILFFMTFLGL